MGDLQIFHHQDAETGGRGQGAITSRVMRCYHAVFYHASLRGWVGHGQQCSSALPRVLTRHRVAELLIFRCHVSGSDEEQTACAQMVPPISTTPPSAGRSLSPSQPAPDAPIWTP